jgi:YidC/Oxa1 family membrane protein insertase
MSQQSAPKQNFWQTMLIMMVLFLGYQTFFGNRSGPTDNRDPKIILANIQAEAQTVRNRAAKEGKPVNVLITELYETQKDPNPAHKPDLLAAFPTFSADQDLLQLRILNELVCDASSTAVEGEYEARIDATPGLTKDQKNDQKLLGMMLIAHTQLKAATERREVQRITFANDTVTRLARFNDHRAIWDQPLAVAGDALFPAKAVTPRQLTQQINEASSDLGKNTPVWGFFPGYQLIDFLVHLTGAVPAFSYGLAALLLAITVRTIIWPLSQRQMMWSRQMSQLGPLVAEIKDQYKDKPQKQQDMNKEVMELYQQYGINPMAGCMPALFQMPLFLMVYQSMLHYRFEFQKGTFLWINPSASSATHGFIARNLGEKDYILIVLYGISMLVTTLLTPVSDPSNAKQQRMMGVSMSVLFGIMMFFWPVPAAFVLYWTFTNILATSQSLRAYRLPLPPLVKKNAPNGGVFVGSARPSGVSKEGKPASNGNGQLNGKGSTGAPKIHKPKKKK